MGKSIYKECFFKKQILRLTQFIYFFLVVEFHLVKTIYQIVSKELLYHSKEHDKLRVLLLGPTGISTVNIGGTTIHSGFGIKPGFKLLDLSNKMKLSLRNKSCEVKIVL